MTIATVYGPTGDTHGTLMGGDRASLAKRARDLGGVQALVVFDDGARECWTMADLGGPWMRAWRREAGATSPADEVGRASGRPVDTRPQTGAQAARKVGA